MPKRLETEVSEPHCSKLSSFTHSRKPGFIREPWSPQQLGEEKFKQISWLRGSGWHDLDNPVNEYGVALLPLAEKTAESFNSFLRKGSQT